MGWGHGRHGIGWSPVGVLLVVLGAVLLFSKIGGWWLMFPLFFCILPMVFGGMKWGHHSHRHPHQHRRWGQWDWENDRWNHEKQKNGEKSRRDEYVSDSGYYVGDDGEIVRRPTVTDDGMWV